MSTCHEYDFDCKKCPQRIVDNGRELCAEEIGYDEDEYPADSMAAYSKALIDSDNNLFSGRFEE